MVPTSLSLSLFFSLSLFIFFSSEQTGSGSYDTVRPLAYQDANVFLLCFNIGDPESLDVAINKVCVSRNRLISDTAFVGNGYKWMK